jgi:16S rRNA pseudouridine516 synthase
MERLDKFLCDSGAGSRSQVKILVKAGRVAVDGSVCRSADAKIDPKTQTVTLDGQPLGGKRRMVVMLNKPAGYLSATEDGKGATVLDLLPQELQRQGLFPVGRLDKDTEGLLLLTNEGGLAHDLLSPRHHVDKVYYTRVAGHLTEEDCVAFESGMTLGDGLVCQPAKLEILTAGEESEAHVTLREGKFHQVKRMLASRGKPVTYLKRLSMGPLQLDGRLSAGQWRLLEKEEILALQEACGLTCMTKE